MVGLAAIAGSSPVIGPRRRGTGEANAGIRLRLRKADCSRDSGTLCQQYRSGMPSLAIPSLEGPSIVGRLAGEAADTRGASGAQSRMWGLPGQSETDKRKGGARIFDPERCIWKTTPSLLPDEYWCISTWKIAHALRSRAGRVSVNKGLYSRIV